MAPYAWTILKRLVDARRFKFLCCPDANIALKYFWFGQALTKNATDAMKESHVLEFLSSVGTVIFMLFFMVFFCLE